MESLFARNDADASIWWNIPGAEKAVCVSALGENMHGFFKWSSL